MANESAVTSSNYEFAPSHAQERPKLTATGKITGIGKVQTTGGGNGDYEMLDLIFQPTRGSRKVFPRIMFRNEMFSIPDFVPDLYKQYDKFPALRSVKPGKKLTLGEVFELRYRQDISPAVSVNKKTGNRYVDRVTGLMAICGGTAEGLSAFAQTVGTKLAEVKASGREPGDLGIVELTREEIVDLIKAFHASLPQVEQALIIKQSTDEDGNPKDQYEVDQFRGPFTQELHDKLVEQSEKSQSQKDMTRRLSIGYKI